MKNLIVLIVLGFLVSCSNGNSNTSPLTCSIEGDQIVCPDGSKFDIPKSGKDGKSCTVSEVSGGAKVTCGFNTVTIDNGEDAIQSPYAITEVIDPCGDDPGKFDEVILKLYDNSYVAYFEDGGKRFLSVLEHGKSYQTTDSQNCKFKITVSGEFQEIEP